MIKKKLKITDEEITHLYVVLKCTIQTISQIAGASYGCIQSRLVSKGAKRTSRSHLAGSSNPSWRGGRFIDQGYIKVYAPDHPRSNGNYIHEHILVAEETLGRSLLPEECVHHLDHDKKNNSPDNLRVMTRSEHAKFHISGAARLYQLLRSLKKEDKNKTYTLDELENVVDNCFRGDSIGLMFKSKRSVK